jgi:hypothetical protein
MSNFPTDVASILNDHTPGEPMPATPSAEVEAARAARLTPEDIERLADETQAELDPALVSEPTEPEPPAMMPEEYQRFIDRHYPGARSESW